MSKPKDIAADDTKAQLARANKIIGWMMPYIGNMCLPENGLYDLNSHCFQNHVPDPGEESKGAPLNQPVKP